MPNIKTIINVIILAIAYALILISGVLLSIIVFSSNFFNLDLEKTQYLTTRVLIISGINIIFLSYSMLSKTGEEGLGYQVLKIIALILYFWQLIIAIFLHGFYLVNKDLKFLTFLFGSDIIIFMIILIIFLIIAIILDLGEKIFPSEYDIQRRGIQQGINFFLLAVFFGGVLSGIQLLLIAFYNTFDYFLSAFIMGCIGCIFTIALFFIFPYIHKKLTSERPEPVRVRVDFPLVNSHSSDDDDSDMGNNEDNTHDEEEEEEEEFDEEEDEEIDEDEEEDEDLIDEKHPMD